MPAKAMTINVELSDKKLKEILALVQDVTEENERLRAELARTKPSWDIAPEWAQWLAQDKSGRWHWFSEKPTISDFVWECNWVCDTAFIDGGNWRNSLEEKPDDE